MRGLLLLATALPAVELPITALTIHPDGAVVERRGRLDGTPVTGLPADATDPVVTVEGVATPRWSWRVVQPADAEDPQARERDRLSAQVAEAEAALARAARRRVLAARAAEDPPATPGVPGPGLPAPAAQAALRQFIDAQAATALTEEAAARARRDAAVAALAALERVPVPATPTGELTIAGPVGAAVTVRHRVPGLRWAPAYRLEVRGGDATLVLLARIDDARGQDWGAVPVTCDARSPQRTLLMPVLRIPQWGATEAVGQGWEVQEPGVVDNEAGGSGAFMAIGAGGGGAGLFGSRSGSGKRRAVVASGGSKASTSAVDQGLKYLVRYQAPDGHLGEAPWQADLTARATLAFLGAGYDHLTPNKYRIPVKKMLAWLQTQDFATQGYGALARTTTALAESHAMTGDSALAEVRDRAAAVLVRRALTDLPGERVRSGPFAGPDAVIATLQAGRSLQADGAPVPALLEGLRPLAAGLDDGTDAGFAASLWAQVLLGRQPEVPAPRLESLIRQIDPCLDQGRLAPLEHATLALFQVGGTPWTRWNAALRDELIQRQRTEGPDEGSWPGDHPAGPVAMTIGATTLLETYYRYAAVRPSSRSTVPALEPLADPRQAARGWPVVWTLPAAPRGQGRREVEVARVPLGGAVRWTAIPVQGPDVWRHLATRNPLALPLPEGPCALRLEGDDGGTTTLPFTAPGAALRLPLGSDGRLRVERTGSGTSEDGWRRREVVTEVVFRLTAPTGFPGTVTVQEPLPRLTDPDLGFEILAPAITPEELARRRRDDPFWYLPLTVAAPTATVSYRLRWPKDRTPVLEYAR